MIDINNLEQILHALGLNFVREIKNERLTNELTIERFGLKIIYVPSDVEEQTVIKKDSWRRLYIYENELESNIFAQKDRIIWELMKAGYMRYLRMEYPNIFRRQIALNGWDRKIIEKRLEMYGDKPKYNYLRELNQEALGTAAGYILSVDPGFYDFLID